MAGAGDLADRFLGERDRLDSPDAVPFDVDVLLASEALARPLRELEQLSELPRIEMALVEELLRGLDDGRDDAGLADDAAGRADRPVPHLRRDRPQLELEPGRAGEGVATLVHRRRAGVRRLAAPRDEMALDAERPEHDPERQVERLEHRPLLDVELEVRDGICKLLLRLERAVEIDAVLRERVRQRDAVGVSALAQLALVGHRAARRGGSEQGAPEARPFLVGPVDDAD